MKFNARNECIGSNFEEKEALEWFVYILYILASLIGIYINGVAIVLICLNREFRALKYYYINSIYVSFFTVCVWFNPIDIYINFINKCWEKGEPLCTFYITQDIAILMVSQFNIIAIAVDRYCSIKYATLYFPRVSHNVKTAKFVAAVVTWVFPYFLTFIIFLANLEDDPEDQGRAIDCWEEFRESTADVWEIFAHVFSASLIVVIALYVFIFTVFRERAIKSRDLAIKTLTVINVDPAKGIQKVIEKSKADIIKGSITITLTVLSFGAFYIPHIVGSFYEMSVPDCSKIERCALWDEVKFEFIFLQVAVVPFTMSIEPFKTVWLKTMMFDYTHITARRRRLIKDFKCIPRSSSRKQTLVSSIRHSFN